MKKFYAVILAVAFFLDYSFLPMFDPGFALGGFFVVSALLAVQLRGGFFPSIGWIIAGGFLLDYVSSSIFGLHVLVLFLAGLVLDVVQNKLLSSKPRLLALLGCFFAGLVFFDLAKLVIMEAAHLAGLGQEPGAQFATSGLPAWIMFRIAMSFAGLFILKTIEKFEWMIGGKFTELKVEH